MSERRLIVGITGASGVIYGVELLRVLQPLAIETHLVMTRAAHLALAHETDLQPDAVHALADAVHPIGAIDAPIASGSFRTMGMVIAPCSVRTFSSVAAGITGDLITRAADVVLKEKRRLVLMVRETPLHAGHLRSLASLAELGAVIAPPVPAFYTRPDTLHDLVSHSIGRVLDLFDIDAGSVRRWGESASGSHPQQG